MPRGDGSGPVGMGPMTGRGAGYCAGFTAPGFANNFRMGFARGIGGGRGFRRMFHLTGLPFWARMGYTDAVSAGQNDDQKSALRQQEQFLENQLKQVKNLLKNFEEEK